MTQPTELRLVLLDEATADGGGKELAWSGQGVGSLQISGTWDGATVTIEGSIDGGKTWIAPAASAYTSNVMTTFEAGNILVRAVVSSAGTTSLSCFLQQRDRA
jgi:hypothetical protein